jgi:probable F420-dependent oxidoreductase
LEGLGYEELWLPDLFGRELFAIAGFVLSETQTLRVATGVANVYARDALSAAQGARTLAELYGGRFVLGLGVSHPQAAEARGHEWISPVRKLRRYLEEIAAAEIRTPEPVGAAPIYIAAHGPLLLGVAAELADGANTYLMPPEHTKEARQILGPDKTLNVVLPCCLCEDPEHARKTGRKGLAMYMALAAYHRQWKRFGFDAILETSQDPELIGGMVIQVGDTVYDASLKTRISQLRDRLRQRSLNEVQSGRDRFSHPEGD